MASQPSVNRNLLRLRAWEQRNQETCQTEDLNPENVPLFGQPYKTNKEDELTSRIKRMLGSYEDINNSCALPKVASPIASDGTNSQSNQPDVSQSIKPQVPVSTQSAENSGNSHTSQHTRTAGEPSPSGHDYSSFSNSSPAHCPRSQLEPSSHQSNLMNNPSGPVEDFGLHHEMSAQSPESTPPPVSPSSVHNDTEAFTHQQLHKPAAHSSESQSSTGVSTLNLKQSPEDTPASQANQANTVPVPSQNVPLLPSSKQHNVVPNQKPTAYVRPMDGQDQAVCESPEIKPTLEPNVVLESINKPDTVKNEGKFPMLEIRRDEVLLAEDILREMTPSWPPLLTTIHTPNTEEPPKLLLPAKPDAAVLSHDNWQLGNWIKSTQQSSNSEVQAAAQSPEGRAHKDLLPVQSSKFQVLSPLDTEERVVPEQPTEDQQNKGFQLKGQKRLASDAVDCGSSRHVLKRSKTDKTEAALSVKNEAVLSTHNECLRFTDGAQAKAKSRHGKRNKDKCSSKRDTKGTEHKSVPKKNIEVEAQLPTPLTAHRPPWSDHYPNICSCSSQSPPRTLHPTPASKVKGKNKKHKAEIVSEECSVILHPDTKQNLKKHKRTAKNLLDFHHPPKSLLVTIDLRLLSKYPKSSCNLQGIPSKAKASAAIREGDAEIGEAHAGFRRDDRCHKNKAQKHEVENKALPRKKRKLANKNTSSSLTTIQKETSGQSADARAVKKPKKDTRQVDPCKETAKDSKPDEGFFKKNKKPPKEHLKSQVLSKGNKCVSKSAEHSWRDKPKSPKGSLAPTPLSQPSRNHASCRPLLTFDTRRFPVKHYYKEAKRLKHKADAESDKINKAYNYLDAAMFFVESGIAMEKDPQISMSSYTIFEETVELLRFVLKLKNSEDSSSPPAEKDFLVLCLKCQSLLQMAMFKLKYQTALHLSKILTEHFDAEPYPSNSSSRISDRSSPSVSSPRTSHGSSSRPLPQSIKQVSLTYVNITMLSLNAHEVWEQVEELAPRGSGMLAELDTAMGPLSLSSSMSCMVRYTRQGVHWLRLDSQKR